MSKEESQTHTHRAQSTQTLRTEGHASKASTEHGCCVFINLRRGWIGLLECLHSSFMQARWGKQAKRRAETYCVNLYVSSTAWDGWALRLTELNE